MKRMAVAFMAIGICIGCGQFEGHVQVKQLGHLVAEGEYESGMRIGTWTYYDATGAVKGQGTYQNSHMQSGLEITFYDNGQKKAEGTWTDGQRDGYWIEYYRSGAKKTEGPYLYGHKTGVWKEYDPSGYYVEEKVYEHDKLVGWREFKRGRVGNPLGG